MLRWRNGELEMIDQRLFPKWTEYRTCHSAEAVADAIRNTVVRGAPEIACAAAYGIAMDAQRLGNQPPREFISGLDAAFTVLAASQPGGASLLRVIDRFRSELDSWPDRDSAQSAGNLLALAIAIHAEEMRSSGAITATSDAPSAGSVRPMLLSVVFSFRNEEQNIPELVRQVAGSVGRIEALAYEMIFVNDDSTDNSIGVLRELQPQFPIRIVNMSRRFGVTPCVLAGFENARGDAVLTMDADLQDPPDLIPEMVASFRAGADVVHTTRTSREGENAFKMWVTRKGYRIINFFSDIHLPENTGDFKLFSKRAVRQILALPEADPYLRGLAVWVGYKQDFVFYRRKPRFAGSTHFPMLSKGPIKEFTRGLASFSAAPLYFALLAGFATTIISIALVIYAIAIKITGAAVQGTSGILIAISFFSGVILFTIGLIGLYVGRIYNEVKGRPRYLIKDIVEPIHQSQ